MTSGRSSDPDSGLSFIVLHRAAGRYTASGSARQAVVEGVGSTARVITGDVTTDLFGVVLALPVSTSRLSG